MLQNIKKALLFHFFAVAIAIQLLILINYWYFIYNNITHASINNTIVYQGKLVDTDSVPIANGTYDMRFRVYDGPDPDTDLLLWEEKWDGVSGSEITITNGLFTVDLNGYCANWTTGACVTNGGVDFNTNSLYLQIALDEDENGTYATTETFSPLKRFSSIAYSMNADKVDGYDVGTTGDTLPLLSADNTWSGTQTIAISSASNKGIVIQGAASQSANLMEFQTSDASIITSINSSGFIETTNINSSKITTDTTGVGTPPATTSTTGYWSMDEGSGSTISDTSGNGNTGTFVGNTTFASPGAFGYISDDYVSFDGTGDYINVTDAAPLDFGTGNFTTSFWIKATTGTGSTNQYPIGKNTAAAGWWFRYNESLSNYAYFWTHSSTNANYRDARISSADYIVDNNWHHIALVRKGTAASGDLLIYIDGVQRADTWASAGGAPNLDNATPLTIGGAFEASAQDMLGGIDNVITYNTALTQEQIVAQYQAGLNTGYGMTIDSGAAYTGSELLAIKNNGTTVASFDATGTLTSDGITSTGQVLATPSSDIVPLKINAYSSQTNNLTEWKNSSDAVVASIDKNGNVDAPTITATNVITPIVTSDTSPTASEPTVGDTGQVSYWKTDDNGIYPQDTTDPNLFAWYKMDTGSGTVLTDNESAYTGTITAATWTGSGAFTDSTNSLTMDGSGDYVTLGDMSQTDAASAFSYNMWAQATSTAASKVLLYKYSSATNYWGVEIGGGNMYITVTNGTLSRGQVSLASAGITNNTWFNLAVTYDGTQTGNANRLKVWVNGVAQTLTFSGTIPATSGTNASNVMLGRYTANAAYDWAGKVDNLAFYSDARTEAEVVRDYRKMQSTYVADYVGTNHGLITGGAFSGSGYFAYTGDNSVNLDGVSDYVAVADTTTLTAGNGTTDTAFSVEAWANLDTVTLGAFASKWSETANSREWLFSPAADGSLTFKLWDESVDGYISTVTAAGVVTSGSWNYYVATYDGSETAAGLKIYKNGVLVSSTPTTSSYTAMEDTATPVWLGAYESTGSTINELDGKLDSIIYWSKELSAAEVLNSYNNAIGSGVGNIFDTQGTFTSSAAKLLSVRNNSSERMYVGLNLIGFKGDADKTIQVDRTTVAATAGYDMTLKAGGAVSGGTNLAGGDVYLISGLSTGTGSSNIYLQTSGGGGSGSSDNSLVSRLIIGGDGSVRIADNTELRFYDSTYYVGFTAPTLSANKIWTLPTADGTNGQVLKTDGSGVLSWTNRLDMTRTAVAAATYNAANSEVYLGVTYTPTGAVTITLPTPTSEKVFIIKDEGGNASTNNITIDTVGSETIDNNASISITTNYGAVRIYSNGTNWFTY